MYTRTIMSTLMGLALSVPTLGQAESFGPALGVSGTLKAKDGVTVFTPVADLYLPVGDTFAGQLVWGASIGEGEVAPLNPFLAGYVTLGLPALKLRVGGGVSLPVMSDDPGKALVGGQAAASRGFWNHFLYAPKTLGIVLPARAELAVPMVDVSMEAALFYLISTADGGPVETENNIGFQLAGELAVPIFVVVDAGLRLQLVEFGGAGDTLQISGEPFVQVGLGPANVRLGLLLNLDAPQGFAFDTNRTWALNASVGLQF